MKMSEMIQEYCNSAGSTLSVDRARGVIRGVLLVGVESRNGRTYPTSTLRAASQLYEGTKVNVNHPKGAPSEARDYRDRIGLIRGVSVEAAGLRGDFHFNPKHPLAEQLIWDAEHAPENVGFSHNAEARIVNRGGKRVVEEITRVQSVDLVADPATTRGLFEQRESDRTVNEVTTAKDFAREIVIGPPKKAAQAVSDARPGRKLDDEVKRFAREITR